MLLKQKEYTLKMLLRIYGTLGTRGKAEGFTETKGLFCQMAAI
jgi:hypothetical protein